MKRYLTLLATLSLALGWVSGIQAKSIEERRVDSKTTQITSSASQVMGVDPQYRPAGQETWGVDPQYLPAGQEAWGVDPQYIRFKPGLIYMGVDPQY